MVRSIRKRIVPAWSSVFFTFFIPEQSRLARRGASLMESKNSDASMLWELSCRTERLQRVVLRLVHFEHGQQFRDLQQVSNPPRQIRQFDGSASIVGRCVQGH